MTVCWGTRRGQALFCLCVREFTSFSSQPQDVGLSVFPFHRRANRHREVKQLLQATQHLSSRAKSDTWRNILNQAQEIDSQLSRLGEGTSVTGLSSCENHPDPHSLEMPPWKPSTEDMCYSACVFFLQRGGGQQGETQSPTLARQQSGAGSHRVFAGSPITPLGPRPRCGLCSQGHSAVLRLEAGGCGRSRLTVESQGWGLCWAQHALLSGGAEGTCAGG